jgi:hypothetical protein
MITIVLGMDENTSDRMVKSWHFTKKEKMVKDTDTTITLPEVDVPKEFYSEYRTFCYNNEYGLMNTYSNVE